MSESEFELDLDELSSAEDFLEYFEIAYEPSVVHVNRLHILQRFHDYLAKVDDMPLEEEPLRKVYADLLSNAYNDFVDSDAETEKVFKVFQTMGSSEIMVPLSDLMPGATLSAPKV